MLFTFPYAFALVYWIIFFVATLAPHQALWAFVYAFFLYMVTASLVGKRKIFADWQLWLNFGLLIASSLALTLVIQSATVRNAYIIFSGAVGALYVAAMIQYRRDTRSFITSAYLEFTSFTYLLTFWHIYVVLFFTLILYDASVWYAVLIGTPATFFLARGIVSLKTLKKSSRTLVLFVLTLSTAEFFIFLNSLPLHYYVLGSLLTLWFYFILEVVIAGQEVSSRKRLFQIYTTIALLAMILILLTARWG